MMTWELEQRLRNEALALYQGNCLTWARRLVAAGLDPYRWSDGSPTHIPDPRGDVRTISARKLEPRTINRRSAPLAAASYDAESNSIECTWTTGAAVLRSSAWNETYTEVLTVTPQAVRMGRLNAGAPFLNSHQQGDLDMVLGTVMPNSARIAGGKGTCRIALSTDPAKAGIVGDIKAARIRNVSVGYRIFNYTLEDAKGDAPPVMRISDWEPYEISAVAAGADPFAMMH